MVVWLRVGVHHRLRMGMARMARHVAASRLISELTGAVAELLKHPPARARVDRALALCSEAGLVAGNGP